ncbi:hypothetical protein COU60_00855 [Candidatus Pacearchaeota archaeon CG10_big_fil_rev_8_21_14_0_10_34_76]|nr:MAG: hypothetical protein COU60_00855 [Candidatus Pacearchaeota archaeon CG10_big_fil_rev_8_21_14_0_10_34_76]
MKGKLAKDLQKGDKILIGGEELVVESIELSEIGKQGTQKCRIETKKSSGEKIILVRPADYPFNCT